MLVIIRRNVRFNIRRKYKTENLIMYLVKNEEKCLELPRSLKKHFNKVGWVAIGAAADFAR